MTDSSGTLFVKYSSLECSIALCAAARRYFSLSRLRLDMASSQRKIYCNAVISYQLLYLDGIVAPPKPVAMTVLATHARTRESPHTYIADYGENAIDCRCLVMIVIELRHYDRARAAFSTSKATKPLR